MGMATATLIPVSEYEYLHSVYEHDCDYVEGELQERSVGERPHNLLQWILATIFNTNRTAWGVVAVPEQRTKIAARRYRVPDLCVVRRSDPVDDIVQKAPLICIEILSPEDRVKRVLERFADYAQMGVENLWLIDPSDRHAWVVSADGSQHRVAEAFTVPGTAIRIELAAVFAELDDMQSQG
jgi:Uma2 family endonuclease